MSPCLIIVQIFVTLPRYCTTIVHSSGLQCAGPTTLRVDRTKPQVQGPESGSLGHGSRVTGHGSQFLDPLCWVRKCHGSVFPVYGQNVFCPGSACLPPWNLPGREFVPIGPSGMVFALPFAKKRSCQCAMTLPRPMLYPVPCYTSPHVVPRLMFYPVQDLSWPIPRSHVS